MRAIGRGRWGAPGKKGGPPGGGGPAGRAGRIDAGVEGGRARRSELGASVLLTSIGLAGRAKGSLSA